MAGDLARRKCKPCEGGSAALTDEEARRLLAQLTGWQLADGKLAKTYSFQNYYQTMAFVNAVAWVAHREDHHPDLTVSYDRCRIAYSTHAVQGLTENDFICA